MLKEPSERKSFQESLPHPRVSGNSLPDVKGLKSSLPGAKVSLAYPDASTPKTAAIRGSNGEKDYLLLFKDARYGGEGGAYNGSFNRKKGDDNREPKRNHSHGGSPDDNDLDDDDNNEDSSDDDTPSSDSHSL